MKEIKFRAKMLDSDDFVYGYYINSELPNEVFKHKIYCSDVNRLADVKEETVGQYTGLKDKNGKEIYEGDILLAPVYFGSLKCVCIYQQENIVSSIQGFGLYSYDSYFQKYRTLVESDEWDDFEVIGNIYDNPELLKEE